MKQPDCPHCWHDTGVQKLVHPPLRVERCCWCGVYRNVAVYVGSYYFGEHGKFHPEHNKATWSAKHDPGAW